MSTVSKRRARGLALLRSPWVVEIVIRRREGKGEIMQIPGVTERSAIESAIVYLKQMGKARKSGD